MFTRGYTYAQKGAKYYSNSGYISNVLFVSSILGLAGVGFQETISNDSGYQSNNILKSKQIPLINMNELNLHNKPDDCWVSVHGQVYDVTEFLQMHPGGQDKLLRFAGKDATKGFRLQHPEGYLERFLGEEKYIGRLDIPKKEKKPNMKSEKNISMINKDIHISTYDDDHQYYKDLVREYLKEEKSKKSKSMLTLV